MRRAHAPFVAMAMAAIALGEFRCCDAFVVVDPAGATTLVRSHQKRQRRVCKGFSGGCGGRVIWRTSRATTAGVRLSMTSSSSANAPPPLPNTDDPYLILGLSSPSADAKEIKRAYKKMALKYHPDVVVKRDSTDEQRRRANDDFARINAAYEVLTGKGSGGRTGSAGRAGSSGTTGGAQGEGWVPPHRRSRASSSYSASAPHRRSGAETPPPTDWRDYVPDYGVTAEDDAKYDAGGDSFGAIFNDLVAGMAAAGAVAGAAGGGRGVLKDLLDFLEGNVEGFGAGESYDDDATLVELLRYGSFDDVANEMDEADLLVQQLEKKVQSLDGDLMDAKADVAEQQGMGMRYRDRFELEERVVELEARKDVAIKYLKKARKRLVKLRERYKELVVEGRGGGARRGYDSSSSAGSSGYGDGASSSSSRSSSSSYATGRAPSSTGAADGKRGKHDRDNDDDDDSWKREGFGSYGRGRSSSGRQRRGRRPSTSPTGSTQPPPSQRPEEPSSTSWGGGGEKTVGERDSYRKNEGFVGSSGQARSSSRYESPSSYETQARKDQDRLREIKVEEDFEKLKRDLGL